MSSENERQECAQEARKEGGTHGHTLDADRNFDNRLDDSGPVPGIAQSSQPKSDTYTWNGELVSLDTTAKTMTVKSRVAYQGAISELKHFKGGDRVWIVWSGIHDSSDAVRQIRRSETGRKIDENPVLPAELVSTGGTQPVPHDASVAGLGKWNGMYGNSRSANAINSVSE